MASRGAAVCTAVLLPWFAAAAIMPSIRPGAPAQAQAPAVDLALVIAIDCSYSVDDDEYRLQREGLARAFRRPEIGAAIARAPLGRIAVTVVQWSDDKHQTVMVPWTIVAGAAGAEALAQRLGAMPRKLTEGGTSLTAVMRYGGAQLLAAPVIAERLVIDISSDGRNNVGGNPRPVRDDLAERGITINGLTILNEVPTLDRYFEDNIVGGPAHFVVVANDYDAYAQAIYRKLLREITGPQLS